MLLVWSSTLRLHGVSSASTSPEELGSGEHSDNPTGGRWVLLSWQLPGVPSLSWAGMSLLPGMCWSFPPPWAQLWAASLLPVLFSNTLYQLHFLYIDFFGGWVEQHLYSFFVLTSFYCSLTFISARQQHDCHGVPSLIDVLHFHHSLCLLHASCLLSIYLEIFFILFPPDLHDPIFATAKRRMIV